MEGAMNRRLWPVAVLLAVAVTVGMVGCGGSPKPDTDQLAGELAEVKADRDRLAALVQQLATTSATLEAYTVNDRQGCLDALNTVRQRMDSARAALKAGKVQGKDAAVHLGSASSGLDDALGGDCAPATP
jgi:hypothetical protein